jgi:hypothetical protein
MFNCSPFFISIQVIEAICSSRRAEEWMVNKYEEDKVYWETLGVASPQMVSYFVSNA